MAHLLYKPPLLDHRVRSDYLSRRKQLENQHKNGNLTKEAYKAQLKTLLPTAAAQTASLLPPDSNIKAIIATPTDENGLDDGLYLVRQSSARSSDSGKTSNVKAKRKGTIADRNDIGRLVYKPNARSEYSRRALRDEENKQKSPSLRNVASQDSLDVSTRSGKRWASFATSSSSTGGSTEEKEKKPKGFRIFGLGTKAEQVLGMDDPTAAQEQVMDGKGYNATPPLPMRHVPFNESSYFDDEKLKPRSGSYVYGDGYRSSGASIKSSRPPTRNATPSEKGRRREATTLADLLLMPRINTQPSRTSLDDSDWGSVNELGSFTFSRRHSFDSQLSVPIGGSTRPSFEGGWSFNSQSTGSKRATYPTRGQEESVDPGLKRATYPTPTSEMERKPLPKTPSVVSSISSSTVSSGRSEVGNSGFDRACLTYRLFETCYDDFAFTPRLFSFASPQRSTASLLATSSQQSTVSLAESTCSTSSTTFDRLIDMLLLVCDASVKEEIRSMKEDVRSRVWKSAAHKWLGFGRLLFSPGHHLVNMASGGGVRILDLDAFREGNWSWYACREYPNTEVYSLTTDADRYRKYYTHPYRPSNHHLILVNPPSSDPSPLSQFSSHFFDVISSRSFPTTVSTLTTPSFTPQQLLQETARILKTDGFIELLLIEPTLDHNGPASQAWLENAGLVPSMNPFPVTPEIREEDAPNFPFPSSTQPIVEEQRLHRFEDLLPLIFEAGFAREGISKCRVWMPAIEGGDQLSAVTSTLGRICYEEAFGAEAGEGLEDLWKIIKEEKEQGGEDAGFRWTKVYVKGGV